MGEKLVKAFEMAQKDGGAKASLRLTMITGISVFLAPTAPDTAENLAKAEQALKEVLGKDVKL
ncbi:MAG: hypothetical protein EHM45_00800 [Desulfobacteraceae bacterium]|nr:MAG: hypothetical protein EHM45_00800 [Desulfobacteraceae bacterium]